MNHLNVSLVKSLVRIAAGFALIDLSFITAGVLFIVAEILGVAEELV
jgi:hypothetical protein